MQQKYIRETQKPPQKSTKKQHTCAKPSSTSQSIIIPNDAAALIMRWSLFLCNHSVTWLTSAVINLSVQNPALANALTNVDAKFWVCELMLADKVVVPAKRQYGSTKICSFPAPCQADTGKKQHTCQNALCRWMNGSAHECIPAPPLQVQILCLPFVCA